MLRLDAVLDHVSDRWYGIRTNPIAAGRHTPLALQAQRFPVAGAGPRVLIVGDSIVLHVRLNRCHTSCHSGAVAYSRISGTPPTNFLIITPQLPLLNDPKFQQSETLKMIFFFLPHPQHPTVKDILHYLWSTAITPLWRHQVTYCHIQQLKIWFKGYCHSINKPYIDSFTTFHNRPHLFKLDTNNPIAGSHLFTMNTEFTVQRIHSPARKHLPQFKLPLF